MIDCSAGSIAIPHLGLPIYLDGWRVPAVLLPQYRTDPKRASPLPRTGGSVAGPSTQTGQTDAPAASNFRWMFKGTNTTSSSAPASRSSTRRPPAEAVSRCRRDVRREERRANDGACPHLATPAKFVWASDWIRGSVDAWARYRTLGYVITQSRLNRSEFQPLRFANRTEIASHFGPAASKEARQVLKAPDGRERRWRSRLSRARCDVPVQSSRRFSPQQIVAFGLLRKRCLRKESHVFVQSACVFMCVHRRGDQFRLRPGTRIFRDLRPLP